MGRWTQYDEDDYRLPSGFKRTGYDADTGQYTFEDHSGNTWNGAAHQEYGTLRRPNSPATMKPRTSSKPATKPATTGSLEEPWTSVTEEMAALNLSELNSNPMYPRTVSQRPNRFVRSAKRLVARIRRSLSVPTTDDHRHRSGPSLARGSKHSTTRNAGLGRYATVKGTTSSSALQPSETRSHSRSKSHRGRDGSERSASMSHANPISRRTTSSAHRPLVTTTLHSSSPQTSPPAVPVKENRDLRRGVAPASHPLAHRQTSTSTGQAHALHAPHSSSSSRPSRPPSSPAHKSSANKPLPDSSRTRLNRSNTDVRVRDPESAKPRGSSSNHRPSGRNESQYQSKSTRAETRHDHRRHVSADDRARR